MTRRPLFLVCVGGDTIDHETEKGATSPVDGLAATAFSVSPDVRTGDGHMKRATPSGSPHSMLLAVLVLCACGAVMAENVDPDNDGSQYAWGENIGWCNTEPQGDGGPGMTVTDTGLTGWIWGENIGWISLACSNTGSCATKDYGVTNDGAGILAGYAWAENAGWISLSCENTGTCGTASYGVTIDPFTGDFSGRAWGENVGWITFASGGPNPYGVRTAWTCPDGDTDLFCAAVDCDDTNGNCTTDCTDADGDGYCITTDCDDTNANCFGLVCSDVDGDTYCDDNDCDPLDPLVNSGQIEVTCDGIDNDCNPATPDSLDGDSDGFGTNCGPFDCDDANQFTFPGAPEVLDHLDNQCPGDPGYGQVDEGMEVTGFVFLDKDTTTWDTLVGASGYEGAFDTDPQFGGCLASTQSPPAPPPPDPPSGQVNYILLHAYGCFPTCIGGPWETVDGPDRVVPCANYPVLP